MLRLILIKQLLRKLNLASSESKKPEPYGPLSGSKRFVKLEKLKVVSKSDSDLVLDGLESKPIAVAAENH